MEFIDQLIDFPINYASLRSDCPDDPSLLWVHILEGTFSHVKAFSENSMDESFAVPSMSTFRDQTDRMINRNQVTFK